MDIDNKSKDVLTFRPKIDFVEPDQEPATPHPKEVIPDDPTIKDIDLRRDRIKALADAVALLAQLVQTEIDTRAEAVVVRLDQNIDAATIQAVARMYPGADSGQITYDQFRQCEENLREYGKEVGKQALIDKDDILNADINKIDDGLRPELDKRGQIIKPINMAKFQDEMLKILMNTLWKKFILPILKPIPLVGSALPEQLVPVSSSTRKMQQNIEDQGVETPD